MRRVVFKLRRLFASALLLALVAATYCPTLAEKQVRQSLTVRDASLRGVLLDVAKRYHASLALPEDLRGSVSVALHDVTLQQALTAILSPLGYRFTNQGGVIVISRAVQGGATSIAGPGRTPMVIPVTNIAPERAAAAVRGLFPEAAVRVDRAECWFRFRWRPLLQQKRRCRKSRLDFIWPVCLSWNNGKIFKATHAGLVQVEARRMEKS